MNWLSERFELSRGGAAENVRSMEGLRGLAVFLVFLVHYATLVEPWLDPTTTTFRLARTLHTVGNAGVDLFFLLSGFLIYGSVIAKQQPYAVFMRRRIQRLYPAFLVVLGAYLLLSIMLPAYSKLPADPAAGVWYVLLNLLLLPGLLPIEPIITVAWSLSYEMFYYIVLPGMVTVLALRERTSAWRCTFFIAAAVACLSVMAQTGGPVRLVMFIAGILLYETLRRDRAHAPSSLLGLLALLTGLACTLLAVPGPLGQALEAAALFVCFFVLCFASFGQPDSWLNRILGWTPARWLGNMSYSYYLIHGLGLQAGFMVLRMLWQPNHESTAALWLLALPMFLLTLIPSAFLFLLVERPFSLVPSTAQTGKAA